MLQLSGINRAYGDNTILHDVSFVVNPGDRRGLIGPNGCGKTTLLRLIAGLEPPDSGSVRFNPPDLRLGFLQQGLASGAGDTVADLLGAVTAPLDDAAREVARLAAALAAAGDAERDHLLRAYSRALARLETLAAAQTTAHDAEAVLAGLGLGSVPLHAPVATLSGGQKTRLGLARLLLDNPSLLLLDEPTNHLDIQALEWLESWLGQFRGAAIIVSHDRTFLDRTVTGILELDAATHTVTEYAGNYSDYIAEWERSQARQWAQWRDEQAEIRRMRQDIARTKEQALGVERTTTARTPGPRRIAKKVAKKALSREKKLDRYLASDDRVDKPLSSWQMKLEFSDAPATGQDVLLLENLAAGYDGQPLFAGVNEIVRAGERVALIGPNGCGKTTLLRVIAGALPPLAGRVRQGSNVRPGYYAQEQENLDPVATSLDIIRKVAPLDETDARSFLHYFLFAGDDVFIPVGSLSYGERARLALARMAASGCNFLLLDEPINHLDIPSRARFEQALASFEGTVLAVVHDRYFIRRFATRVWSLSGSTLTSHIDLDGALK